MDIGSIFVILALAVLVGLYISRPFFVKPAAQSAARRARVINQREHTRSSLLAERDRVLTALQDLEFDFTLGKIPAEDYPIQRAELMNLGAQALRQLDEMDEKKSGPSVEARLEASVAARRADAARSAGTTPPASSENAAGKGDEDLEALVAARRRSRQEKSVGFCPKCGKPASQSDRFCSRCGATL
jgi:NADH pyrophosphatase NudC (nudix superfamily)